LEKGLQSTAQTITAIVLLIMAAVQSVSANSTPLRVVDTQNISQHENISRFLDYIEQRQRQFAIEDLVADQTLKDMPWVENHSDSPGFGFDTNTFWFRVVVSNNAPNVVSRLLEIKNPVLDEVLFYQVNSRGVIENVSQTGDGNPASARPFFHHNLILPFTVPPTETHYLYFRVTTAGSLEFPVILWEPGAFQKRDQIYLLLYGALFGVILVMGLYNFFIYALFRDRSMIFYSGFSIGLMLFLATIHGFSAQYFWPDISWLRENALILVIPFTLFFSLMFSSTFLQLDRALPRLNKAVVMLAMVCLAMLVMAPLTPYSTLIRACAALVLPVSLGGIVVGVMRWLQGYQPARYFVIAWTAFLGAISFYALSKFGLFSRSAFSEYAVQVGAVAEAVLFAFALADRMNMQRKAFEQAQAKALDLQKAANERLEMSVADRTVELQAAMQELEEANQRLQSLTRQDGLTGIRNRRFFDEKLEHEWQRSYRSGEPLALLLIDIDYFKVFNDEHGHLTGDECLKAVAQVIDSALTRPSDSAARFGGEEFVVILPETNVEGAVHVAENIRLAVAGNGVVTEEGVLNVTVSIGAAALIPQKDQAPQALIAIADQSLYAAKSAGRNCTRVPAQLTRV